MLRPSLLVIALLALPAAAGQYPNTSHFGVPFSEDEDWHRHCMRVRNVQPPAIDGAVPAPRPCDPINLYYDTLALKKPGKADWSAVRACADAKSDHAVLMMLYANGYGVAQNTDLAIKHACMLDNVAKAEMESRVAHLAAGPETKRFDLCDDITSGRSGTLCTAIRERQRERARATTLAHTVSALPAHARPAFDLLEKTAKAYAEAMEADMQGTAAPALHMAQAGRELEAFKADVTGALKGTLQASSQEQYRGLVGELDRVFQQVLAKPSDDEDQPERIGGSTISRDEIAAAQRAWLAYRDAWPGFLEAAGKVDRVPVLAALTKRRIKHLTKLLAY